MTDAEREWIEDAGEDFEMAGIAFREGKYRFVRFCCHQAVEKTIKGIIAGDSRKLPPRMHNIELLAKDAKLVYDAGQKAFMDSLTEFYLSSRYRDPKFKSTPEATEETARELLAQTEAFIQWLRSTRT